MEEKNFFRRNFNYPILLLALYSLTNISNIIGCISAIFRSPGSILSILLSLIVYCAPIAIAVVLWLHRTKGMENIAVIVATIFCVLALINAYSWVARLVSLPSNTSFEIEFIMWQLPGLIEPVISIVIYALLAISFFTKQKISLAFYAVSVFYIIELCFFGIIRFYAASIGMGVMSSALACFVHVFYVLAVWYIPSAVNQTSAEELTSGKAMAIGIIAAMVVGIYIIALLAAGGSSGGSSMNGWDRYDSDNNGYIDDYEFSKGWNDYIDDFLN